MISIIPNLLDAPTLTRLRELVAGAPFVDGKATAGNRARRVKNNEMLQLDHPAAKEAAALVQAAILNSRPFNHVAFPKAIRPVMINRYVPGMAYGPHVDNALMGRSPATRSDLSLTVFISDPAEYDGGELTIMVDYGQSQIKLPAGHMVLYPSSSLHRVAPVSRGTRIVAVSWVQSHVRDPGQRQILFDIDRIRSRIEDVAPDAPEADLAFKTYSNLLRLWAET